MLMTFSIQNRTYRFDSSKPIDISIPLRAGSRNVKAFYAEDPKIFPMKAGSFIGDVAQGGSCNVNEIHLNVHCSGTHTECVGHISKEKHSLNQCLKEFFFIAQLITVTPEKIGNDEVITGPLLAGNLHKQTPDLNRSALIIRTLPNDESKMTRNYSGKNAPYMDERAAAWLRELETLSHLLIDLPSIDKEDDNKLLAHHAWWNYPEEPQLNSTITELIYVPDSVPDGYYLLNLQITSLENDASPSKPVLYALQG